MSPRHDKKSNKLKGKPKKEDWVWFTMTPIATKKEDRTSVLGRHLKSMLWTCLPTTWLMSKHSGGWAVGHDSKLPSPQ